VTLRIHIALQALPLLLLMTFPTHARAQTSLANLKPVQIANACGGTPAGRSAPESSLSPAGNLFIQTVLREQPTSTNPVAGSDAWILWLNCKYHWTDGAKGVPNWLELRDTGYRKGTWSCDVRSSRVSLQPDSLRTGGMTPILPVSVVTLNQPALENWDGWFDIKLDSKTFTIKSSARGGLGFDIGPFPGELTLSCPTDNSRWETWSDAINRLQQDIMDEPLANPMSQCSVIFENLPTHRRLKGACSGATTLPGLWAPARTTEPTKAK